MAAVEVLLPQWGMGMSEGTITTWLKAEVEAEKVEETLEAPATGTLTEIRVPVGETVEVRTVVAIIETD